MMQVRECSIGSIHEIAFGILETNGKLTLLKKNDCKVKYPFPLIQDGKLQRDNLQMSGFDIQEIKNSMQQQGIEEINDVFLCIATKSGFSFIKKSNLAFSKNSVL